MEKSLFNYKFIIDGKDSEEYGEYTSLTAKLLKRPYITIHRIFEKEQWPLSKIRERYHYVTKHNGTMPADVLWWYLRKKDKE